MLMIIMMLIIVVLKNLHADDTINYHDNQCNFYDDDVIKIAISNDDDD